jgi:hypothetical protein
LERAVSARDARLLDEAREAYPEISEADCTHARLQEIARRHGVDFATAVFYDRVRSAPRTNAFLDRLAALGPAFVASNDQGWSMAPPDGTADRASAPGTRHPLHGRVLIAPGAFYREHPQYGSDGRAVREAALRAGLTVESLPVASLGTVRENAAIVRRALTALEASSSGERDGTEPVVLVSLSKGGADVRVALEDLAAPPRSLRAWINICGLVHGTPVADRVVAQWWRRLCVAAYLALRGGSLTIVRDLAAGSQALLARPIAVPPGVLVINVIGFPLRRHLFGLTRARHRFMASWGPSDGLALLRDAIVEPGLTLPVWGSDHYFRAPGVPDILDRLFRYLGQEGLLSARAA